MTDQQTVPTAIQSAVDYIVALRSALDVANIPGGINLSKAGRAFLAQANDTDKADVVIATLLDFGRTAKPGKAAVEHEATCNTRNLPPVTIEAMQQATRDLFATIALPEADKARLLEFQLAADAGKYVCNCKLAKKRGTGTRSNPEKSGPVTVTVTAQDGTVTEYASASKACTWLSSTYHTKQCDKYVAMQAEHKSANARLYINADIKAGRFPEGVVIEYSDDADEGGEEETLDTGAEVAEGNEAGEETDEAVVE